MKIHLVLLFSILLSGVLVAETSCDVLICLDNNIEKTDSLKIGFKGKTHVLTSSELCKTIQVDCTSNYFYMSANGGFETVVHKVPKMVLSVEDDKVEVSGDRVNKFLLNRYSYLSNYSVEWGLAAEEYGHVVDQNLEANIKLINEKLAGETSDIKIIREDMVKVEEMIASHYLSNYQNINRKKDPELKVNLLRYLTDQDLKDTKYEFNVNNLNFQYSLFMDSIIGGMPDHLYPYKAFEALNESVGLSKVKRMIADRVLLSSVKDSTLNIDSLVGLYISNIGEIKKGSKVDLTLKGSYGIKIGAPVPDFGDLADKDGVLHSRNDLLGKNIVLMTWGTWCPYCSEEFGYIKGIQNEYPDVSFVFVSFDKDKSKWKDALPNLELNGLHLIDPESKSSFKSKFVVNTTNRFFLIDKGGIVLESENISSSKGSLVEKIKEHF